MRAEDKPGFAKLLAGVMAGYGKPLPDRSMVGVWFDLLTPFAPSAIAAAFAAYTTEQPDFAPTPNGIAARARLLDGRLGPEEAWALSLTSTDQTDTIVWSTECAEAFRIAKPVLDSSGAISARKAFLEAYERLVAAARAAHKPVEWIVSVGWDTAKCRLAVGRAVKAGFLPAPAAVVLLPAPTVEKEALTDNERAQLRKVLDLLSDGDAARQRKLQRAEQERRGAEMALDIEIQRKVDGHLGGSQ